MTTEELNDERSEANDELQNIADSRDETSSNIDTAVANFRERADRVEDDDPEFAEELRKRATELENSDPGVGGDELEPFDTIEEKEEEETD